MGHHFPNVLFGLNGMILDELQFLQYIDLKTSLFQNRFQFHPGKFFGTIVKSLSSTYQTLSIASSMYFAVKNQYNLFIRSRKMHVFFPFLHRSTRYTWH